jgi:hypothetical protein
MHGMFNVPCATPSQATPVLPGTPLAIMQVALPVVHWLGQVFVDWVSTV